MQSSRKQLEHMLGKHRDGYAVQAQDLLEIDPHSLSVPTDVMNLGVLWRVAQDPEKALRCYQLALNLAGDLPAVWTNMGNVLKDLKRMHHACAIHQRAITAQPQSALAWYNYGITLAADSRYQEAVNVFKVAMALPQAQQFNSAWELARCMLALGDYAQGWDFYQSRWHQMGIRHPYPKAPTWDGTDLKGKRLLLWPEQGFGDTVQCLRFLDAVQQAAGTGHITVAVQPELLELAQASYPKVHFVSRKADPVPFEVQAALLDLPRYFCRHLSQVPASAGYLRADPARGDFAKLRLQFPGKKLVGVVWTGSLTFAGNADRAMAAAQLLEPIALPGVQLLSLQKGADPDLVAQLSERYGLHDLGPQLHSFSDTAAALANLDLVVMTDSSVAHLCGALGVPVWVLLARNAHWLWLTQTDRSPWYDSMRFFRQTTHGDWRTPLDALAAELQKMVFEQR